jgi:bifunctional non-homologous end joining protein LigD
VGTVHTRLDEGNSPWKDYEASRAGLATAMKGLGFKRSMTAD